MVFVTYVIRKNVEGDRERQRERQNVFIIMVTQIGVLSAISNYTMDVDVLSRALMDYAMFVAMKCVPKGGENATVLIITAGVFLVVGIDVRMVVSIHLLNPRIQGLPFVDGVLEKSALLLKTFATLFLTNAFAFVA